MHKDRSTVSAVLDGIVVESIVVDSLPMCMYRRRLSLRSGFESESTSRALSCLTGLFCNGNVAVHKDRIIVGAVLNGIIVDLTVVDGIAVGGRAVEEIVEDGTVADRIKADGGSNGLLRSRLNSLHTRISSTAISSTTFPSHTISCTSIQWMAS